MSNGKLKAQYNRVRTSVALQGNNMWTNTIGIEQDPQAGSNSAIEASLRAPSHGGGAAGRVARRERAQELIKASGYSPSVTDYEGLVALARAQGNIGSGNRGACKICGGLGHLTKRCRNYLGTKVDTLDSAAHAPGAPVAQLGLLQDDKPQDSLSSLDVSGTSSDDSSSSDSSKSRKKKRKRKKKHKREKKKRKHSSKVEKKHKSDKPSKKAKH